jgi:hypothetical protein
MGTENYHLGKDYISQANLETKLINLEKSKTKKHFFMQQNEKTKEAMFMKTKSNEAKVQCFLTKWLVDSKGCMYRMMQSDTFVMQGNFKPSRPNQFELEVSEDSKHVFIKKYTDDT